MYIRYQVPGLMPCHPPHNRHPPPPDHTEELHSTRSSPREEYDHTAMLHPVVSTRIIRAKRVSNCYTQKKKSVCACVRLILVLVWKKYLGFSVGYVLCTTYVCTWYQRALRCQLRGRPFHPWAGRLRFSGEAHPGPATLTQSSSSFSCGAGLQSESRLLLCCAPVTREHATHVYSSVHACS